MKKILVPLDGTDLSESALPVADQLATALEAEVILISVTQLPESPAQAEEAERDSVAYLERAAARLTRPVRSYPRHSGDPERGILKAVEDEEPMFVVMSTRGRSSAAEFLFGSVSNELMQSVPVPIVLVPPTAQGERGSR